MGFSYSRMKAIFGGFNSDEDEDENENENENELNDNISVSVSDSALSNEEKIEKVKEYLNQAIDCYKEKNLEGSLDFCNKAIDLDKDFVDGYTYKALLLTKLEKISEANEVYNHLFNLQPNDLWLITNRGMILDQLGLKEEAKVYFDKLQEMTGFLGPMSIYYGINSRNESFLLGKEYKGEDSEIGVIGDSDHAIIS